MTRSKLLTAAFIASAFALFFGLGLHHELTLANLQASRAELLIRYESNSVASLAMFFAAYVLSLIHI